MRFLLLVVCILHGTLLAKATKVGRRRILLERREKRNFQNRRHLLQHRKLRWAEDDVAIPDQFIVVFTPETTKEQVNRIVKKWWLNNGFIGTRLLQRYESSINGISIKRVSINILRLLLQNDHVMYIEEVYH